MRNNLVTIIVSLAAIANANVSQSAEMDSTDVDKILRKLPSNTEILVVAQYHEDSPPKSLDSLLFDLSALPIGRIRQGSFVEQFQLSKSTVVVQGSRNFRPSRGRGSSPLYDGCHVLCYADHFERVKKGIEDALFPKADEIKTNIDRRIARFAEIDKFGTQRDYYVAFLKPYVVIATNFQYLNEFLAESEASRHAEDLKKFGLELESTSYCARIYSRHSGKMLSAFALCLDKANHEKAYLRHFGKAVDSEELAKDWTMTGSISAVPEIERVSPQLVEIRHDLSEAPAASAFQFLLLVHLRHLPNF